MQVIPAIDLMNGKVVRLTQGDPNKAKVYDYLGTPTDMAKKWKAQGAQRLHIIDLDGAFERKDNLDVIAEITKITDLPIQVGGGIRSPEKVERIFNFGIKYAILGALAFRNQTSLEQILQKYDPERIIIALDNKDGKIRVEGWKTETSFTLSEALKKFSDMKVKSFLITSIAKDGMLQGPDVESLKKAVESTDAEIIAAGGIGSINDLFSLKKVGVDAVVVGKALYEERFTLKEAIEKVGEN